MGKYWVTINGKKKRTKAGIRHEYDTFQSSEKSKKDRAARNSARRSAIKSGRVHKGDGKDVDHIRGIAGGNGPGNLRVMSAHANRGRRQSSRLKRSARKKKQWGK